MHFKVLQPLASSLLLSAGYSTARMHDVSINCDGDFCNLLIPRFSNMQVTKQLRLLGMSIIPNKRTRPSGVSSEVYSDADAIRMSQQSKCQCLHLIF